MPAAMLARRTASASGMPTASADASVATTVSPAPVTSNTRWVSARTWSGSAATLDQRHPRGAAGDQDRLDRRAGEQRLGGGNRAGVVVGTDAGECRHFFLVGRDHGGAGEDQRHRHGAGRRPPACRPPAPPRSARRSPFHRARPAHSPKGPATRRRRGRRLPSATTAARALAGGGSMVVGVDAEQLLPAGKVAGLDRGRRPGSRTRRASRRGNVAQSGRDLARRAIVAGERHQRRARRRSRGRWRRHCRRRRGRRAPAA